MIWSLGELITIKSWEFSSREMLIKKLFLFTDPDIVEAKISRLMRPGTFEKHKIGNSIQKVWLGSSSG